MLYEKSLKEVQRLDKLIQSVESQIKNLPEGKLYCIRDGKRYKWVHYINNEEVYLKKTDRHLAELLAKKRYLTLRLEELKREKRAIEFYIRHHQQRPWKSEKLSTDNPEFQKLLSPYFKPMPQRYHDWANSTFDHNQNFPEKLIYKIPNGKRVRSKSEALIAMVLYNNKIPFRYECALQLGETTVYPDFTILHPETGEVYYFEHFGLIDNPGYRQKALNKLNLYIANGIIPTVNLITTYETKDYPLDLARIEKRVNDYLLS